jgi:hypothetical protein
MTKQETVIQALEIFAPFVAWMDISFSMHQDFISQLFKFLQYPLLYHHVLNIFTEIILKGMPTQNKLQSNL